MRQPASRKKRENARFKIYIFMAFGNFEMRKIFPVPLSGCATQWDIENETNRERTERKNEIEARAKHENFIILLWENFEKLKTNAERTPRIFKTNKERTKRNRKIEQARNRREIKIEAATKRRKRKNELRKNSEKNNFARKGYEPPAIGYPPPYMSRYWETHIESGATTPIFARIKTIFSYWKFGNRGTPKMYAHERPPPRMTPRPETGKI